MIVYRVHTDITYQDIALCDNEDYYSKIRSRRVTIDENTTVPDCYIRSPKGKRGNFFCFGSGNFVFDNSAYIALSPFFSSVDDVLPIRVERVGTLTYWNPMFEIDALDAETTRWRKERDGKRRIILGYRFFASKLTAHRGLFKLPKVIAGHHFTVTGIDGITDDFYTRYHEAKLTGLKFQKVWSSEE